MQPYFVDPSRNLDLLPLTRLTPAKDGPGAPQRDLKPASGSST
jgi:hypothetical protein